MQLMQDVAVGAGVDRSSVVALLEAAEATPYMLLTSLTPFLFGMFGAVIALGVASHPPLPRTRRMWKTTRTSTG